MMKSLVINDSNEKVLPSLAIIFITLAICCVFIINTHWILAVLFFSIGVVAFITDKRYKFTEDFQNEIQFVFLNKVLWKYKFDVLYPDYISVFHASYKTEHDDGDVHRFKKWTVRFFKENKYTTIFAEDKYEEALQKAKTIGDFFDIEIYDVSKV